MYRRLGVRHRDDEDNVLLIRAIANCAGGRRSFPSSFLSSQILYSYVALRRRLIRASKREFT